MECPKCHAENPSDSRFCGKCATPLPIHEEIPVSPTKTLETSERKLKAGNTFAGRYQIIEELGKGGMGKVYKVFDSEIKENVALKLLKPEISADKKIVERFQNELKFARKISHRNVCRMFDLNKEEETHYISMEYVPGEDLKSFIKRSGQLTVNKAVSIATQVCEGLAEAHGLGVVHRDLKPQNIMVDKEGNARIMDFGIARFLKGKGITDAGVMIGTPEYMSPEQVEGKEADSRSDIYALGVILYEMLAGRVPFEGDTPISIAVKHKTEIPPDPIQFNAQIPEDLDRVILRCLEKDKGKRFQSAEEVLTELKKIESGITPVSGLFRPKTVFRAKKRRLVLGVATAATILILAAVVLVFFRGGGLDVDPKRVVVARFENKTGDISLDSIGSIAADWITQGISKIEFLDVVPSMAVQQPSGAKSRETEGPKDMAVLRSLARETSAGTVVSGAYYLVGGKLQFQARITDIQQEKIIHALKPLSGEPDSPMRVIEDLSQQIMGALAVIFDTAFSAVTQSASTHIPIYEAYQEYMIGNGYFGQDYAQALRHFERAVKLDPDFMAAHLRIAVIYGNIENYAKADSIVQLINQKRELLTPFERNLLDWYAADLKGKLEESLRFLRRAEKLAPKYYIINYLVGLFELRVNNPRGTVETYAKMELPEMFYSSVTGSWRFSALADAHHMLGNYKKELEVVQHVRKHYPDLLWLRNDEVRALSALGRIDEVKKVIDESLTMTSQAGSPGRVMIEAVRELRTQGYLEESREIANQAVDWYHSRPSDEEDYRSNLARALYTAERWEEAQTLYEKLAEENPDNIDYIGYLGVLAARRGDRDEAKRISEKLKNIDKPYLYGDHTYWRACIVSLLGERQQAVALLREAFAQGRVYDVFLSQDIDLEPLRNYSPFQELIRPKS